MVYCSNSRTGSIVTLADEPFAKGGRSTVYPVADQPRLLAKIIAEPYRSRERELKVAAVRRALEEGRNKANSLHIAEPLDDLVDGETGEWVGYLMTKLEGKRLDAVADSDEVDLVHRLVIAWQLSKEVVRLNSRRIVIGDLALENCMLVDEHVYILDPDSFQVYDPVSKEFFAVSEAHAKSYEMLQHGLEQNTLLTSKSDDFLLAVCVHELLFGDPFVEWVPDMGKDEICRRNILNRRYAFLESEDAFRVDMVGRDIGYLFYRAFATDNLPTAREWVASLEDVVTGGLVQCPVCGWWYPYGFDACPNPECGAPNRANSVVRVKKRGESSRGTKSGAAAGAIAAGSTASVAAAGASAGAAALTASPTGSLVGSALGETEPSACKDASDALMRAGGFVFDVAACVASTILALGFFCSMLFWGSGESSLIGMLAMSFLAYLALTGERFLKRVVVAICLVSACALFPDCIAVSVKGFEYGLNNVDSLIYQVNMFIDNPFAIIEEFLEGVGEVFFEIVESLL